MIYVEDLQLSRLHRIILEVMPGDSQGETQKSSNAEINMANTRERSALSSAALRVDHTAVNLVLEAGADVDQSEEDTETPQLYSVERDKCHVHGAPARGWRRPHSQEQQRPRSTTQSVG